MAFAGLRGTGDWGTDERPKNFRELILWTEPNGTAPLTALMSKMKSEAVDDPQFSWWEEENNIKRVQMNATGASSSSTAFGLVSGGLNLVAGDVLLVEKTETTTYDNELVMVTAVASDTAITVIRGAANTSAAATGASAWLTRINNAFSEGSGAPDVSSNNPTKKYNYAQIWKTAFELTNTSKKTKIRTGDPLKNDKKRRMFDHSVSLEMAWLWGRKHEDTGTNGKPRRFCGGLREFITTNSTVFTTTPTEDTFLNATYPVFDYAAEQNGGGNERLIMAGNGFLNSLNKLAKNGTNTRINFQGVVKAYGMDLQKWILPQGTFLVKTHPLMNVHSKYTNSAFVINPAALTYRYIRDTHIEDNIQLPGEDTHKGQWLTEAGLEVHHEKTMAYIGNFVV